MDAPVFPSPLTPDALALHGVDVAHHFGGGVYAKQTHIPAGIRLLQHVHPHDHLSILAKGSVLVEVGEFVRRYEAPACIELKAGVAHAVNALTDTTWFCIHATEETDPARIDTHLLEQPA